MLFVSLERSHGELPAARRDNGAPRLVLVELFTSEGCSSCPPADALLKELSERQPVEDVQVVALEEHVDYWNNLGWRDPFSSSEFTDRQSGYAHAFGNDGVYTPQMIVDGKSEFVGSRSFAAREAINRAGNHAKFGITLHLANANPGEAVLQLSVENQDGVSARGGLELWVAVTEKNLQSDVRAGENSGELLKHGPVVRSLRKEKVPADVAGYQTQLRLELDPAWKKENVSVVAFLADADSRQIAGVGTVSLSSSSAGN